MKTCKACRNDFEPMRSTQVVCATYVCAQAYAQAKRELAERKALKLERAETKRRLLAIKPRKDWLKEAQVEFNRFIKARDARLACISCGRHHQGQWHAGHYLSVGARPELRFDEDNVHKQCQPCNTHLHANLVLYRVALASRIGDAGVDRLEGPHQARKYSIEELKLLRDTYRAKTRALLAEHKEAA